MPTRQYQLLRVRWISYWQLGGSDFIVDELIVYMSRRLLPSEIIPCTFTPYALTYNTMAVGSMACKSRIEYTGTYAIDPYKASQLDDPEGIGAEGTCRE